MVDGLAVQRSLVVVVSDFRGPYDWHKPMLRVAGRHPTVAIEIRDPREQQLADVGELRLVDPETGRQLRVDTSSRQLRERFAAAADETSRSSSACSTPPASATSRSRPRATGSGRSQRSCAEAASCDERLSGGRQMSFASPWLLLFLLVVPLAIGGYLLLERRRARRALLKYSFSEVAHTKSVTIVDIDHAGNCQTNQVALTPRRELRILDGYLEDILKGPTKGENRDDYLLVRLDDKHAILDAMGKLREVFPNVLHLERPGLFHDGEIRQPGKEQLGRSEQDLFTQSLHKF